MVGHEKIDLSFGQSSSQVRQHRSAHDSVADPIRTNDQYGIEMWCYRLHLPRSYPV
jgi:hypothetical protein